MVASTVLTASVLATIQACLYLFTSCAFDKEDESRLGKHPSKHTNFNPKTNQAHACQPVTSEFLGNAAFTNHRQMAIREIHTRGSERISTNEEGR